MHETHVPHALAHVTPDVLDRAVGHLTRLARIEYAHLTDRHAEVSLLLAGVDPVELMELVTVLRGVALVQRLSTELPELPGRPTDEPGVRVVNGERRYSAAWL